MIPPQFTLPSPTCVWSRRLKGLWSDLLGVQNSTWIMVFVVSEPALQYVFVNSSCMIPPPFTLPSPTCVISSTEGVMEWSTCSPEFHVEHRLWRESTCTPLCFCEFLLHDSSSIHLAFSYVCVISLTVLLRGLWSGAQNSTWIMVFVVSQPVPHYVFVKCLLHDSSSIHFAFSYVCVISSTEGVMEWSTWCPEFHVDHGLCGEWTCTPVCFCEFLLHDSSSIHFAFSYMCDLVDWRGYGVIYL